MAKRGADPAAHVWTEKGPGVLGEIVQDAVLRQWGLDVYADLQHWDPFDGWRCSCGAPSTQNAIAPGRRSSESSSSSPFVATSGP